jgi:hypothetical protein
LGAALRAFGRSSPAARTGRYERRRRPGKKGGCRGSSPCRSARPGPNAAVGIANVRNLRPLDGRRRSGRLRQGSTIMRPAVLTGRGRDPPMKHIWRGRRDRGGHDAAPISADAHQPATTSQLAP